MATPPMLLIIDMIEKWSAASGLAAGGSLPHQHDQTKGFRS